MTGPGDILVTGAGGFIGGATARLLAARGDGRIFGATRDGRDLGHGIAARAVDVRDLASLDTALRGVGGVVHCAYGDAATTIGGTNNVLAAAKRAGVRRVVHVSSIAVYADIAGAVPETAPLLPPSGRGYAHWKAAAEAACRATDGIEVTMLRPAIVYGPGSVQWVVTPARRLLSGHWPDLGAVGGGNAGLVHVNDVAAACALALTAPVAGEAFNIVGPETISWREWYARLAASLRVGGLAPASARAWRLRVLAGLPLKIGARLPGFKALGARAALALSPAELRLFGVTATYPTAKARALLGWQPAIGLEQGLLDCMTWLRAAGIAP